MTGKKEKVIISIVMIVCVFLALGIFKMNKDHKEKVQAELIKEEEQLAEEEKQKEEELAIEKEKADLEFVRKIEETFERNQRITKEREAKEVPVPETSKAEDEEGNTIDIINIPEVKPSLPKPEGMEKPKEPTKEPKEPIKEPEKAKEPTSNVELVPDSENPFLNTIAEPSKRGSNSEDIGDGNYKPGEGDKF